MSGHGKSKTAKHPKKNLAYYQAIAKELNRLSDLGCDLTQPSIQKFAEAYSVFEQMVTIIDKDSPEINNFLSTEETKANALSNMGLCCLKLGEFKKGKKHLLLSIQLNPTDFEAQIRMARTLAFLESAAEANTLLEKLCTIPDVPPKIRTEAYSLFVQNALRYEELVVDKKILELRYQLALKRGELSLQPIYESCLAKQFFKAGKFEETINCLAPFLQSKDLEQRTDALYNSGVAYYQKEFKSHDTTKAIACFKEVVQLYQNNPHAFCDNFKLQRVALSAHSLAKIYEDDNETLIPNAEEALKYYHIGAELNLPECLHDLGYKYEHGEDVETNLEVAIHFYERAAKLNSSSSMLNLGCLLAAHAKTDKTRKAGIKWLSLAANDSNTAKDAYHNLGAIYSSSFQTSDNTDKTAAETALRYFQKAAELGSYKSMHNMANMLLTGEGIEANEANAIIWYKKAAQGGLKQAYKTLIEISIKKLRAEKDTPRFNENRQALSELMKESGLYSKNGELAINEIILEFLKLEHFVVKINFIKTNDDIVATAKNRALKTIERLKHILNKDVKKMDTINICTAIHRIGSLTERSLDERDFHRENLPNILILLNEALTRLNENRFNAQQVTNLIEGISKLHLKATIPTYAEIIEKLYTYVLNNQDNFNPRNQVTIIYAATRLDSNLTLFKETLFSLIKKALYCINNLDAQARANLIYSQAILNPLVPKIATLPEFNQLMDYAAKTLTADTNQSSFSEEKTSYYTAVTNPKIGLHQNYLAIYYFHPHSGSNLTLDHTQQFLENFNDFSLQPHVSKLQTDVVEFLSPYALDYEEEKNINTLPVDAYITLTEKDKIILQVDGPSHFLHGEDDLPAPTQKTLFRNAFLTLSSGVPVVSVPYFEWNLKKTHEEKFAYLAELVFDATGIKLEASQWKKAPVKKQYAPQQFFTPAKDSDSKDSNLPKEAKECHSRAGGNPLFH